MRFKAFLHVTVAALPLALAACADSASEIRAKYADSTWTVGDLTSTPYDRGSLHFNAGRFGLAVKHFEIAISQDPDSVKALNGLAASFDRLQRYQLAERYYLRALNLEPDNLQTLNNLGYSYMMQGRHDLALAYLKDALEQDPMNDMVRDNLQQAEASFELESQKFLASAVGSAEFMDVAPAPRYLSLHSNLAENPAPSAPSAPGVPEAPQKVQIKALAAPEDIWIERSSAAVQTLVTRPSPDLLDAMRDAGLSPRIGNFRNQAALTALQTQPAPWQATRVMIAEAMVERELAGAIRQDRLSDHWADRPEAAPTVAVDIAELPRLSATVFEEAPAESIADLPQLSAVMIGEAPSEAFLELPQLSAAVIEFDGLSDARPVAQSVAMSADPPADGMLGGLRQISAALMGDGEDPAEDETPSSDVDRPMIREEAAVSYETIAYRPEPNGDDDLPDLPPDSDESPVIEISNGTGRAQMAARISQFLDSSEGLNARRLTNAEHFRHQETVIFYRREWLRKAKELAAQLPVEVRLEAAPNQTSDIRIRLGGDLLNFDQELFYASREPSIAPTG